MQFTKNEATKDFHFTVFGILILLLLIVSSIAWSYAFTGVKYKLLTKYGVDIKINVLKIEDVNWSFAGREVSNTTGANSKFKFQFTTKNSENVVISTIIDNQRSYNSDEKIIERMFEENEIVEGKYLESYPKLALPTRALGRLAPDWGVFRTMFLALLALFAITIWRIFEYRKLKRKMKYD